MTIKPYNKLLSLLYKLYTVVYQYITPPPQFELVSCSHIVPKQFLYILFQPGLPYCLKQPLILKLFNNTFNRWIVLPFRDIRFPTRNG